jgi:putative resolvase
MKIYSPKQFGLLIGRTTQTLQLWDRKGLLPAKRTPTDRRYYTHDDYLKVVGREPSQRVIVSYCRVSSAAQKKDLASQRLAVEQFCIASGRNVTAKLEDIGSGLNYKRKQFIQLMQQVEQNEISEIVIAHKDRLGSISA